MHYKDTITPLLFWSRGDFFDPRHSERSDEGAKPKNLRIIETAKHISGGKILRLRTFQHFAQDDTMGAKAQLPVVCP